MDAGQIAALLGGGSLLGVVADRLLTWLLGRRAQQTTLADVANQIAERTLLRLEVQLAGAERHVATANATIIELRAEVAQLHADLAMCATNSVERDRLVAENASLRARIQQLTGGSAA